MHISKYLLILIIPNINIIVNSVTLNVLAILDDKSDYMAYVPIEILLNSNQTFPSYFFTVLLPIVVVLLIGVSIFAVWYYMKYKKVQTRLDYEQNDIRNMASVPKSDAELSEIREKSEVVRYSNLTEDASQI